MVFEFYISLILVSGVTSVLSPFLLKTNLIDSSTKNILILWFIIRFISDFIAFIFDFKYQQSVYPIFHISTFVETVLMISFYRIYSKVNTRKTWLLYILPISTLLFDITYFGSIFDNSILGHTISYLTTSILLFTLILHCQINEGYDFKIIRSLFVYHSVIFVYSLFQQVIRDNLNLMTLIYPIFFISNVGINLYPTFLICTKQRS
jgi:hypothetical protein